MVLLDKKPKISVKSIHGNVYIYSWEYIPVHLRKDISSKYRWVYVGPLNSKRTSQFLGSLSRQERFEALRYIEQQVSYLRKLNDIKKQLTLTEPYSSEYKQINKINNRLNRIEQLKQFDKKLNKIARKYLCNKMHIKS